MAGRKSKYSSNENIVSKKYGQLHYTYDFHKKMQITEQTSKKVIV